jgi:hypothetical protein
MPGMTDPPHPRRRPTLPALLWLALLAGWLPLGAVALDPDRPSAVLLALYVLVLLAALLVTFLRGAAHGWRRSPGRAGRSLGAGTAAVVAGFLVALPLRPATRMPVADLLLALTGSAAALALLLALGYAAGTAWRRLARRVVVPGRPLTVGSPAQAPPPDAPAP